MITYSRATLQPQLRPKYIARLGERGNALITDPTDWRYLIDISRAHRRNRLEFYAVPLRQRLPNCRIPLRPPDADVVLDLMAVLNRTYDIGSYDLPVDCSALPDTLLRDDELAWLRAHLQEKNASETTET